MVPVMAAVVDRKWFPGLARRTLSEVERGYRRYGALIDDDFGQTANVSADTEDNLDDVFALEAPLGRGWWVILYS